MSLENRNGKLYYYRARKVAGRVMKEYLGAGSLATLAAEWDAEEREQREAKAEKRRNERQRLQALDEQIAEIGECCEALAQAVLLANGYHRHHRGEWRKKRRA